MRNMIKPPRSPIHCGEGASLSEWFCPIEDSPSASGKYIFIIAQFYSVTFICIYHIAYEHITDTQNLFLQFLPKLIEMYYLYPYAPQCPLIPIT